MDAFRKDEDTVHREVLWKTIAHHIEAVPAELKSVLEENKFDRLIILGNLDEKTIKSLPLDAGPRIFLSFMVKRIQELTVAFLNDDLNSRIVSHSSEKETPNQKTSRKRKAAAANSVRPTVRSAVAVDEDFEVDLYRKRIAILVANFLNTQSLSAQVKPEDVGVMVSKNLEEPPVVKIVCIACKALFNVALKETHPGVFYPTLSNFFKHFTKSHSKSTKLPLMNKDILTAFTRIKKNVTPDTEQESSQQCTNEIIEVDYAIDTDVEEEILVEYLNLTENEQQKETVTIELLDANQTVEVDSKFTVARQFRSVDRNWKLVREIDVNQPLITNYYECIERIVYIAKKNHTDLSSELSSTSTIVAFPNKTTTRGSGNAKHKLLLELVDLYNKTGKRISYGEEFRTYCTYMYILTGPKAYNTLRSTLPLTSLRTAQKHLHQIMNRVKEGELRVEQLKRFLDLTDSPPVVWLSEDATRIVSKLQIDPATGNIIGTLLLKDEDTGMPILLNRNLESISQMKSELNSSTLTINAVVTMARPLKNFSPPFCLMVMGCDNKFTAVPVTKRRKFIIAKLNSEGILVPGSSSDGDSRYTSSQKQFCGMYKNVQLTNVPADWMHWFNTPFVNDLGHHCIQDTVHIMGKMRNNLFNAGSGIRIGNFVASKAHLRIVIQRMPRAIHKLNLGDILSNDKMNYSSIEKLLNPQIEKWILENVPGGNGTVIYLKLMRYVNEAFTSTSLTPLCRIYKMAFTVMVLRIWKASCKRSRTRFMITSNIYACIEMNFHELIKLINYFREKSMDEYILPTLYGSQDCEEFFRHLRSMTTLCSTIVNFSMLDLLHRVHRVDFMNYAENTLLSYGIVQKKSTKSCQTFQLPGLDETVLNAQIDAENAMLDLGLEALHPISAIFPAMALETPSSINVESSEEVIMDADVVDEVENNIHDDICGDVDLEVDHNYLEITTDLNDDTNMLPLDVETELRLMLGESASNVEIKHLIKENVSEKSSRLYFNMLNADGKEVYIKKSTVVWLFNNVKDTVSSDRLYRFVRNNDRRVDPIHTQPAGIHEDIRVGDWCEFEYRSHTVYGNVVGFEYINGKSRNYTLDYAPVKPPSNIVPRGIFVYANWFERSSNTVNEIQLTGIVTDCRVNIDQYKKHVTAPTAINNVMTLN